jgi:hypothetical protein
MYTYWGLVAATYPKWTVEPKRNKSSRQQQQQQQQQQQPKINELKTRGTVKCVTEQTTMMTPKIPKTTTTTMTPNWRVEPKMNKSSPWHQQQQQQQQQQQPKINELKTRGTVKCVTEQTTMMMMMMTPKIPTHTTIPKTSDITMPEIETPNHGQPITEPPTEQHIRIVPSEVTPSAMEKPEQHIRIVPSEVTPSNMETPSQHIRIVPSEVTPSAMEKPEQHIRIVPSEVTPSDMETPSVSVNYVMCDICYEEMNEKNESTLLPCQHSMCKTCLDGLIKNASSKCPYCRTVIYKFMLDGHVHDYELDTAAEYWDDEYGASSTTFPAIQLTRRVETLWVTCPYNQSHNVPTNKYSMHVVRCGRQFPHITLLRCPHSPYHEFISDKDLVSHLIKGCDFQLKRSHPPTSNRPG